MSYPDYYSSGASGLSAELLLGMAKSAQETYEQNFGTPASVEDNGRLFEVDNDGAVTYYEPANPLASIYDVLFGGGLGGYLVGYQGPDVKAGDRVTVIPLKDTKFTWDGPEDDYDPDDYDDYLDDEYGTTIPDLEDVVNHPRGIVEDDIHATQGVLQRPAQGVSPGEERTAGRAESGNRLPELPGAGPSLPGLSSQGPSNQDDDDFPALRGNVGVGQDSAGNRPLRGSVRELSPKDARGTAGSVDPAVVHPSHYTAYKGLEVIQLTEQMNFNRGNAVKYIARAGLKDPDSEIQDLEKAAWYINREIARLNGDN